MDSIVTKGHPLNVSEFMKSKLQFIRLFFSDVENSHTYIPGIVHQLADNTRQCFPQ